MLNSKNVMDFIIWEKSFLKKKFFGQYFYQKRPNYVAKLYRRTFLHEKIKRIYWIVGFGRNVILWNRSNFSRFFTLVYVCAGRNLNDVLWAAGSVEKVGGPIVDAGSKMFNLCYSRRIYYRNYCK